MKKLNQKEWIAVVIAVVVVVYLLIYSGNASISVPGTDLEIPAGNIE